MPRFAANLSMMFNEVAFVERFAEAAKVGFKGVECLFPYAFSADAIAERLDRYNLQQVLFNMPPGDWRSGERGLASLPGREAEFEDNLEHVLLYARATGCKQVHMMAGIPPSDCSQQLAEDTFVRNLSVAARKLREYGITVMIEPINSGDVPGYFLHHQDQAIDLLKRADEPNTALQMDLYHCHLTEGNLATHIRDNISHIGHFQIAGAPGRHEPDIGEINYPALFDIIDSLNYSGWVSCEYRPTAQTQAGLGWAAPFDIGKQ